MRMRKAGWPSRTRHAGLARLSSPGTFKLVAVATTIVAAGVSAGSAAAAGQRPVSLQLRYTCAFPSAPQPVNTLITATFPAAGTAGKPIQPTGTGISVTLPQAVVADLATAVTRPKAAGAVPRQSAAAVTLTASLGTKATEGTRSVTVIWRDLRSPDVAIPRRGPLTLTASGSAPSVTAAAAGKVTFSASRLSLLLTAAAVVSGGPAKPSGTSPGSSSTPGRLASIRAACVPRTGQDTILARIAVAGPAGPKARPAPKTKFCQPFIAKAKLNPRFPLPKPLPGATRIYFPEKACAYSTGFTNAKKLNEAALIGPGLTDLILGIPTFLKSIPPSFGYLYQRGAGSFEYHGLPELPPAHATLLGFGFTPVSATIQLSEIGPLNIALISCGTGPKVCPHRPLLNRALVFGRVSLRIYDVNVNGVALNVGLHCQTIHPFNLELLGVPPTYNIGHIHGVLTGTVTIPSFSGCANGADNLDPIFNATVSGPGNFVKVNQALPCFVKTPTPTTCPPRKPRPVH